MGTPGDYGDGSSIYFDPGPRMSTTAGRVAAGILLVAGCLLVGGGATASALSSEVKNNGVSAVGTLTGYQQVPDIGKGLRAVIRFDESGGDGLTAYSHSRVSGANTLAVGSIYRVYYDPKHPERTFVDGIDQLYQPIPVYAAGGAFLLAGILFATRPPRAAVTARPGSCRPI